MSIGEELFQKRADSVLSLAMGRRGGRAHKDMAVTIGFDSVPIWLDLLLDLLSETLVAN